MVRTDLSLELHLHEISYLIYGFIHVHFLMSDGALFGHNVLRRCYLVTMMMHDDYNELVF